MNAPVVEKESYSRGRGPRHTAVNRDVTHTVPGSREREIFSNTVLFWFDDLVAHGQKKKARHTWGGAQQRHNQVRCEVLGAPPKSLGAR